MNGSEVQSHGTVVKSMQMGDKLLTIKCLCADLLLGFDLILGMDVIKKLGGVTVTEIGEISFGEKNFELAYGAKVIESPLRIDNVDFIADFNGKRWIVEWKWKDNH